MEELCDYERNKIALCCIGKLENLYIREFVLHYKSIGFDKIFIYDNNDINGERFETVIEDFIYEGFVELVNYRGNKLCQTMAYQDCYDRHRDAFRWMLFCDCDEFLCLKYHNNIKDYIKSNDIYNFNCIKINWNLCYDNGKLFYDGRSLFDRFKTDDFNKDNEGNKYIKCIIRTDTDIKWENSTHVPLIPVNAHICNESGDEIYEHRNESYTDNISYNYAYFNHFITKTISEYVTIKKQRLNADLTEDESRKRLTYDFFFMGNEKNEEKIKIIKQLEEYEGCTLPFEKIFCLHLIESKERQCNIEREFKNLGIYNNVKIWETTLLPEIFNEKFFKDDFPYGSVGCALGHYQIIKYCYENGHDNCLIMEDDITFIDDKQRVYDSFNAINGLYDWDCVKFYWKEEDNINEDIGFTDITNISNWTALCYAVNRKFMKFYLDFMNNNFNIADYLFGKGMDLFKQNNIKVYGLNNKIINNWKYKRMIKYE